MSKESLIKLLIAARKKGSDDEYRAWIQKQPSCISGRFSEYVDGEGRCIAAHVRRAGESGIGFKAGYACVPMTKQEHDDQHQYGEGFVIGLSPELAKAWFDNQRIIYLQRWVDGSD